MATEDEETSLTGGDSSDEGMVESLVAGREKRNTAGRHMSTLLNAEADDDLALLFAEDEEDDEFDEDEGAAEGEEGDDMRLDPSSEDEDDQGPHAADDDMEGERELETQAKVDRLAKKRKAQESLRLTTLRKKVKIDPTAATSVPSTAPRPKKKSERLSWLPTVDEGPVRSSSRRQTMKNKEITHARLKDSEKRRIRLIATMEEAAKRKERLKPKTMTQAERLAEAEKIERLNSKSLNRWEEMEKRKAEERMAKLEALQNRRLEGPVMSWWSGLAKWINGKLVRVGNVEVKPKPDKEEIERKKKGKESIAQEVPVGEKKADEDTPKNEIPPAGGEQAQISKEKSLTDLGTEKAPENQSTNGVVIEHGESAQKPTEQTDDHRENVSPNLGGFLDGIHLYASLPETSGTAEISTSETAVPEATSTVSEAVPAQSTDSAREEPTKRTEDSNPEISHPESKLIDSAPTEEKATQSNDVSSLTVPRVISETTELKSQSALESLVEPEAEPLPNGLVTRSSVPAASAAAPSQSTEDVSSVVPIQEAIQVSPAIARSVDEPSPSSDPVPAIDAFLPPAPEFVEETGRNLLILENFDDKAVHSREYSIYFNFKKPPRLTSMCSCQIQLVSD